MTRLRELYVDGATLVTETCCKCKVLFAMSSQTYEIARARNEGFEFFCPNGHGQHYLSGESAETKLRRELQIAQQQIARAEDEAREERQAHEFTKRQLRSQKGAKTILKRRIAGGKCPCCSEHFPNLERHMKAAHPDGKVVPMKKTA